MIKTASKYKLWLPPYMHESLRFTRGDGEVTSRWGWKSMDVELVSNFVSLSISIRQLWISTPSFWWTILKEKSYQWFDANISLQIPAMFLSVFKMAVLLHLCSRHPPCITTTTVPGVPGSRPGITVPPEEAGLRSTITISNGYRLTWVRSVEWRGLLLRADMMLTSLWSPIRCLTAWRVTSSCLIQRGER